MKRSLRVKLILSFLAVALITVLVVSALTWLTSGQSLMNLVVEQEVATLKERVETYYANHGNLEGFDAFVLQSGGSASGSGQLPPGEKPPRQRDTRAIVGLVDQNNRALIPTFGISVGQVVPAERLKGAVPVTIDGAIVARIVPDSALQFKLNPEEELFLKRTTFAIALAALAGVLSALVLGLVLSGALLKPIRRLTRASQALARGELQQQVPVTSEDELGQLTATFNQMSADLSSADMQRKRLTADITHDLSTPIQVISGYVEMVETGAGGLTPQRLEIIKTELDHLRRLVADLGTLSQADAGGLDIVKQPVRPGVLLERVYQSFQPIAARQGVALELNAGADVPEVVIDEGRMLQVLKNLLENALRHTPAGGRVVLRSAQNGGQVRLEVSDTGSGIEPEDLPYIFDRFYQADKARGSNQGKMGLGLSICKALVEAQSGKIAAYSEGKGRGTSIVISFENG